jgi:hypothetical protein
MQKFMMVNVFDYTMPSLLTVFEPIVLKDHEYPELIIAVHEDENDCRNLHFQTINLSTSTNWYPQPYGGRLLNTHTVCQLEKDTVLVCYERLCKFVTVHGSLKPSSRQASQLDFDHEPQQIVCLQGSVLSFYEHGMQGKNLLNGQVTSQVTDRHRKFRLLGSDKVIIIESRPSDDLQAPSNIYILAGSE